MASNRMFRQVIQIGKSFSKITTPKESSRSNKFFAAAISISGPVVGGGIGLYKMHKRNRVTPLTETEIYNIFKPR